MCWLCGWSGVCVGLCGCSGVRVGCVGVVVRVCVAIGLCRWSSVCVSVCGCTYIVVLVVIEQKYIVVFVLASGTCLCRFVWAYSVVFVGGCSGGRLCRVFISQKSCELY